MTSALVAVGCFRFNRFSAVLLFLFANTLFLPGCSVVDMLTPATVYRGVTPQEAEGLVAKFAGTVRPAKTVLGEFYEGSETWLLQDGTTWNCNNRGARVVVSGMT